MVHTLLGSGHPPGVLNSRSTSFPAKLIWYSTKIYKHSLSTDTVCDARMQSLIGFGVHTGIGGTDIKTDRQQCWKKLLRFSQGENRNVESRSMSRS